MYINVYTMLVNELGIVVLLHENDEISNFNSRKSFHGFKKYITLTMLWIIAIIFGTKVPVSNYNNDPKRYSIQLHRTGVISERHTFLMISFKYCSFSELYSATFFFTTVNKFSIRLRSGEFPYHFSTSTSWSCSHLSTDCFMVWSTVILKDAALMKGHEIQQVVF